MNYKTFAAVIWFPDVTIIASQNSAQLSYFSGYKVSSNIGPQQGLKFLFQNLFCLKLKLVPTLAFLRCLRFAQIAIDLKVSNYQLLRKYWQDLDMT